MGMGYAACHAQVTTLEKLRALVPNEINALEKLIGGDWDALGITCEHGGIILGELNEAIANLENAFLEKTGLVLAFGYYDRDEGDRYDDLEPGIIFFVEGVYTTTPAGEKHQDLWQEAYWVRFG